MAEATDYRGPTQVGSHALARAFAADGAEVCWLGTPLYPTTMLRAGGDATSRRRIAAWWHGGQIADDRIVEYYPMTLLPVVDRPVLRTRLAARQTLRATLPRAAGVIRRLGFATPDVLWLSNSRFSHALPPLVRARITACRVSDDWAHFANVPAALIALHEQMVDACGVVFVTSRRIQSKMSDRRPDAIYLPNAVADFFFAPPGPEPAWLARFPHPRIVFVGKLDAWVDFDTIAHVGERMPDASVLVVGPGRPALRSYPANVHFTGATPYPELPSLLAACDVGLVPFVKSELTHAVSPLKLFEYLAAGLPTVATRLDEIAGASSPAILCDSAEEFARAVASVADGDPAGRAARVAFAREHTWPKRFAVVKNALGL